MGIRTKYLAMLLALCGLWFESSIASAGQLICKYHTLKKSDEKHALAALSREIGALEVNRSESFFCRNPGNARAWFVTKRVQSADSSFDHVTAGCSRGWLRWTCDVSKVRTIDFRFDSESKAGVVTIPQGMPTQYADSLFRRADKIAREQVTADRSCLKKTPEADDYALRLRDGYISKDNIDGAEITSEMERKWDSKNAVETGRRIVMVIRGLMYLQFVPEIAADGTEELRFDCWDVQIIVG